MVTTWKGIKVGEYAEWNKYFVEYKGHTLVVNMKQAMSSFKLLQYDYMAKKMYEKKYKRRPVFNWQELDESEKVYGSKDISLPNSIDNMMEEIEEAVGVLERGMKYAETKLLINQLGWEVI